MGAQRYLLRQSRLPLANIRYPRGPIYWYMRAFNLIGLAAPWRLIYIMPGHETDQATFKHEQAHLHQMDRDGTLTFIIQYPFQILRYGYWNAPYEIEARLAESQ